MPFERGKPKTGGRKSGTPNKATGDIKARIAALIDERFDDIAADMDNLDPKDRVTTYLKLLEFVVAKQRAVEHSGTDEVPITKLVGTVLTPEKQEAFVNLMDALYGDEADEEFSVKDHNGYPCGHPDFNPFGPKEPDEGE